MSAPRQIVRQLTETLRSVEQAARGGEERPSFSTGIPPLDRLLSDRGLRRGTLIEWLPAADEGGGANVMGLLTARAACGLSSAECGIRSGESSVARSRAGGGETPRDLPPAGGPLVVIDRHGTFYPPAAMAWGIPLANMVLLRPATARDEAWALDQVLRSPAVAAVLAWPHRLDGRAFRRLQLAVESSGAVGVLVRPAAARHDPTWADFRFQISSRVSSRRELRFQMERAGREMPNRQDWRFCVERLHARCCVQQQAAVQIAVTPEGEIHEVTPAEHSPSKHGSRTYSQSAI